MCGIFIRLAVSIRSSAKESMADSKSCYLRSGKEQSTIRNDEGHGFRQHGKKAAPAPEMGIHEKAGLHKESGLKRRLPTLPRENRSTIGVSELNFSV
ncbi:MAG: hypothetical protein K2P46_00795, partial [Alistipes sp.]|nr:hypothetical protein [Alistipes sp.]